MRRDLQSQLDSYTPGLVAGDQLRRRAGVPAPPRNRRRRAPCPLASRTIKGCLRLFDGPRLLFASARRARPPPAAGGAACRLSNGGGSPWPRIKNLASDSSYEPAEFYTALTLATGMKAPTSPQPAPIKPPPGDDTEVLRTRRCKPHGPDNGQYNDQSRDNENSKLLCGCASKL